MQSITASDWIQISISIATFFAVLVALFGERIWRYFDSASKSKKIKQLCLRHLEQMKADFIRIRDERNPGSRNPDDRVRLNIVSFNEIKGGLFLYENIIVNNLEYLNVVSLKNTIDFFHHYNIFLCHIKERRNDAAEGWVTLATYNRLLGLLQKAITELS
ncbi:MAG: hypothetical protein ISS47_06525 [Candidatus Omnitrophica bacterium]|nr:hypothetical protein [Candidatus Omnitrophota bacterium]